MTNVLILGYGNIGKHIYDELKTMNPYIYDPNIPQYNNYPKINIDIAFVCVPTDSQADGSCDTSIVEKTIKKCNAEIIVIKSAIPVGTAEYLEKKNKKRIVVVPRDYERYHQYLEEENVVFVKGRVSEEDDASSKLICEKVIPFGQKKQELWIQYPDKETFLQGEKMLYDMLASSDGNDEVIVYCKAERAVKRLPSNRNVNIEPGLLSRLMNYFGESCVKVVEKPLKS